MKSKIIYFTKIEVNFLYAKLHDIKDGKRKENYLFQKITRKIFLFYKSKKLNKKKFLHYLTVKYNIFEVSCKKLYYKLQLQKYNRKST